MFLSQTTYSHLANNRFSFRRLQILISQTTDFHVANYRFSFRFVCFRFAKYSKPLFGYIPFHIQRALVEQLFNIYIIPLSRTEEVRINSSSPTPTDSQHSDGFFPRQPVFIVFFDGVRLPTFSTPSSAMSKRLGKMDVVVDKLHFKNHVDRWCKAPPSK